MGSMVDLVDSIAFDSGALPLAVPIVVTPPSSSAVSCNGVWLVPTLPEVPVDSSFGRGESRRTMAILKSDVASVPRLTTVDAPLLPGGTILNWQVDGIEDVENNKHVVVLIPEP